MTTTLTVLGGSAASIGTGQGCSGYLLSTSAAKIVLDLGPGTLQELRKHTDFRELDACVISHMHVDHMLDLLALRFSLAYNPIRPDRRTPLWLPPGGLAMLDRLSEVFAGDESPSDFFGGAFELHEYDPAGPVTISDCQLRFAPTVHYIPCWSIRVTPNDGSGALCYTADTGPTADLADQVRGARVLLSEATSPEQVSTERNMPGEQRGHLTPTEAASLASAGNVPVLVLSHMYEEHDPAGSVDQVASAHPEMRVIRATPGTTVTW